VKAITYRALIGCLDFLVIYLFTHELKLALGFLLVSNLYTAAAYFFHERLWNRITWGMQQAASTRG
jgi:adenylylsulfate kinase